MNCEKCGNQLSEQYIVFLKRNGALKNVCISCKRGYKKVKKEVKGL